jgi:hypothetical protein
MKKLIVFLLFAGGLGFAQTSTSTATQSAGGKGGTAAGITALIQSLTGCGTATYVYTPAGSDCVAVSGGGGTVAGSGTVGTIPVFVTNSTTIGNSLLTDTGTALSYSGTGGIDATSGFTSISDGVHAGILSLDGNTTAPAIPSNSFGFVGPNSASFTSWFIRPSSTGPSASCVPALGAVASGVSAMTCGTVPVGLIPTAIPIGSVGSAGLSGTSPVTINAAGAIGCATCNTSSASVTSVSVVTANGVSGSVATATSTPAITVTLGAITPSSVLATGIVDGTAPVTITTATTGNLGSTYNSGYTLNQEATAGTGVTYTLPATAVGKQYCIANSGTTSVVNTGVLTVYPPSSSYVILNGVVNTVGGGGTHGVASGGAAGDAACFVAIDATHWQVWVGSGTWTEN